MTTEGMTAVWESSDAAARGVVYEFLARGFGYPVGDRAAPGLLDAVGFEDDDIDHSFRQAVAAGRAPLDELRSAHLLLFPQVESRDCPSYETAYRGEDVFQQADVMADVAGFYAAHGLRVGGEARERPDHITTELEFMSFLHRKEAYALDRLSPEHVAECRHTQALFVSDHLGCWAPGFARRVELVAPHPFYRALAVLLGSWLASEIDRLEVTPAESVNQPLPETPVEEIDCGEGGCGPSLAAIEASLPPRPAP